MFQNKFVALLNQTKTCYMNKHFIALVKMAGDHEGKIGQHSTDQPDEQAAIRWGKSRFNRPFAIVEMPDPNKLSLETQEAEKLYNILPLHENN